MVKEGKTALAGEGEDGNVQLAVGTAVERRGKTALVDEGETGREQQAEVRAAVGEAVRER